MGRRRNEELDAMIMKLYALGYTPKMIASTVAEELGRRYSHLYIKKRISLLKKEGKLTSRASVKAWDEVVDWYRSAKAHLAAAEAALSVKGAAGLQEARSEIERAATALERMHLALRQLYMMYAGKVAR